MNVRPISAVTGSRSRSDDQPPAGPSGPAPITSRNAREKTLADIQREANELERLAIDAAEEARAALPDEAAAKFAYDQAHATALLSSDKSTDKLREAHALKICEPEARRLSEAKAQADALRLVARTFEQLARMKTGEFYAVRSEQDLAR